ncbi:non-ribosomal peptide synthetase [Nitratireductor pacificus]|uniref:Amino acid adenylation domain-containing protein n=1 Tax=Nitratireductor pacificus pht-3B TaxID=391937 RepID=K2N2F6_9HYPH|nr:non-ribosomal peptide synthetase [Nitratireductor pacificus]EKF18443.1 amino acid adenylation domain-containing protein [Nitratireductor pacificus pht-3B]
MNGTQRQLDFPHGRPTPRHCEAEAHPTDLQPAVPGTYDRQATIHGIVAQIAAGQPDAVALQFDDDRLTYGELDRQSSLLAHALIRLGVVKGDVVGLLLPRAIKTLIAKLAILKAGAAYAPFDPAYPAEHLAYVIDDCAPRLILTEDGEAGTVPPSALGDARQLDLDAALAALPDMSPLPPGIAADGGDAAYVMYTSGSTGRPKGVVIPHRGVVRLVRAQNYIRFRPQDVILHTATISFDAATFEIWGALLNGCRLVGIGDRTLSLPRLAQVITDHAVSVMLLTTGLFHLLVDHQGPRMHTLRHVLFGGEVASAEHARRFLRRHPNCVLTNAYGPTEVTVMASAFEVPSDFAGADMPIGHSIAHSGVHILDDRLAELPPGSEGQLAVSGDGLAIGYMNRPDLTAERFVTVGTRDGNAVRCYLTGDMAVMGEDGLLHFRGRRDRQIKIDGKRIELDEIEAALRRDEHLSDAVVQCHQAGNAKRIVAFLKPRKPVPDGALRFAAAVLERLRSALPAHMIPSKAIVLDAFPMNPAGKVDRSRLTLPAAPAAPPAHDGVQGTRAVIARLWEEVLGTRDIGPEQNFFDLGGTSMQLMRVHAALEQALGRTIDVVAVFEHPNIASLARFLDAAPDATAAAPSIGMRAALRKKGMSQFRRGSR